MHPYQYRISITARHPSAELTDIAEQLKSIPEVIPGRLTNVGEERATPVGGKLDGLYTESVFRYSFSNDLLLSNSKSSEITISEILESLEVQKGIFDEIQNMGGTSQLVMAMYIDANSSVSLNPDLLKRLSALNIEFSFDVYPPDNGSTTV